MNAAKISLPAYFTSPNWPLNEALSKGSAFWDSTLGNIMSEFHLVWSQVAPQLLNYKKETDHHIQGTIDLDSSDLRQRICDSLLVSTLEFLSQTLKRICNPQLAHGPELSNYSLAIIFSFPSLVHKHLEVLANNPENSCFGLFVHAVNFWIDGMAERFPKTVAGDFGCTVGIQ
jgi:hypothetical protein